VRQRFDRVSPDRPVDGPDVDVGECGVDGAEKAIDNRTDVLFDEPRHKRQAHVECVSPILQAMSFSLPGMIRDVKPSMRSWASRPRYRCSSCSAPRASRSDQDSRRAVGEK